METGRPSATADRAALLRAAHRRFDRVVLFDDPLAEALIDAAARRRLDEDRDTLETPLLRALRITVALRSRHAEERLAAARARGVRQYVLLGAGLDTFACRVAADDGLRVFEVDHPATQQRKRERLAAAGLAVPPHLVFVPCDFERQTFVEALDAAGFDRAAPAVVAWLGVTMYLTRDAIAATLAAARTLAPGSEVIVEYAVQRDDTDPAVQAGVAELSRRVAALGEPWQTRYALGELPDLLQRQGFTVVEDLGPADTLGRYAGPAAAARAPRGGARLAVAAVPAA